MVHTVVSGAGPDDMVDIIVGPSPSPGSLQRPRRLSTQSNKQKRALLNHVGCDVPQVKPTSRGLVLPATQLLAAQTETEQILSVCRTATHAGGAVPAAGNRQNKAEANGMTRRSTREAKDVEVAT